jgi:5-amino-6-(5-phosphoribosylamino)uracil reductase
MSLDGYIDDMTGTRLQLSNDADFDRVDEVRAGCDAILVGAGTIRKDDPRLLVRSAVRRDGRLSRGLPATPTKVTITGSGDLDPASRFFTGGDATIVYAVTSAVSRTREMVGAVADVVDVGEPDVLDHVLDDLVSRGVHRLLVEGGSSTHTRFLTAGLVDELHLVVAPFFVGDARAPRFVDDGGFPWNARDRARLVDVVRMEDVVLLRYALSDRYPDR